MFPPFLWVRVMDHAWLPVLSEKSAVSLIWTQFLRFSLEPTCLTSRFPFCSLHFFTDFCLRFQKHIICISKDLMCSLFPLTLSFAPFLFFSRTHTYRVGIQNSPQNSYAFWFAPAFSENVFREMTSENKCQATRKKMKWKKITICIMKMNTTELPPILMC